MLTKDGHSIKLILQLINQTRLFNNFYILKKLELWISIKDLELGSYFIKNLEKYTRNNLEVGLLEKIMLIQLQNILTEKLLDSDTFQKWH
ncbi:hypothetical protein D3C71_1612150 [compost metagenome]